MTLIDILTAFLMADEPGLTIWQAQELAEQYILETFATTAF